MSDHNRKIAMAALSNLCAPDDMRTIWVQDLRDDVSRYIKQVEQERDKYKEELAVHQRMLAGGVLYSIEELIEHDAKAIDKFIAEVAGCAYMSMDIDENYEGAAELVVNFEALQNIANKLHQKAKESE